MKNELSLEEIQQESFKVLLKIKEIFDENGWEYYLAYGTLIGAVRHKGFIPWDDDIDIWVPRSDYEKFINYCIENKESLYPFELHHYKTNKKYIYTIARFSDSRYKIDYTNTKDYGLGLFVDIYPLDGLNKKDKGLIRKIRFLQMLIWMCGSKKMIKGNNKIINILKVPIYCIVKILHIDRFINKLLIKDDKLSQKYSFENSEYVDCICWCKDLQGIKKDELQKNKDMLLEFNGEKFKVPYEYDKVLKKYFGDYMKLPPEEERIAHHFYSAYKKK